MWEKEDVKIAFQEFINENQTRLKDSVNGMMKAEYIDCNPKLRSITLRFHALPWEANRSGLLHGGIMAAMLDHVCNLTVSYHLGHWAPTLSMNIEYIRPAHIDDVILATAEIISAGKRILRINARLQDANSSKLIASCSASFFNKEADVSEG